MTAADRRTGRGAVFLEPGRGLDALDCAFDAPRRGDRGGAA